VRVPDEAASVAAKVTLSFPDWTERKVIPATYEIPIVTGPKEEGK
jgi:hypothetical protein